MGQWGGSAGGIMRGVAATALRVVASSRDGSHAIARPGRRAPRRSPGAWRPTSRWWSPRGRGMESNPTLPMADPKQPSAPAARVEPPVSQSSTAPRSARVGTGSACVSTPRARWRRLAGGEPLRLEWPAAVLRSVRAGGGGAADSSALQRRVATSSSSVLLTESPNVACASSRHTTRLSAGSISTSTGWPGPAWQLPST